MCTLCVCDILYFCSPVLCTIPAPEQCQLELVGDLTHFTKQAEMVTLLSSDIPLSERVQVCQSVLRNATLGSFGLLGQEEEAGEEGCCEADWTAECCPAETEGEDTCCVR